MLQTQVLVHYLEFQCHLGRFLTLGVVLGNGYAFLFRQHCCCTRQRCFRKLLRMVGNRPGCRSGSWFCLSIRFRGTGRSGLRRGLHRGLYTVGRTCCITLRRLLRCYSSNLGGTCGFWHCTLAATQGRVVGGCRARRLRVSRRRVFVAVQHFFQSV